MKLYVVGIGPGELSQITPAAMAAATPSMSTWCGSVFRERPF